MSNPRIQDLLLKGIQAARTGDRAGARRIFQQVLIADRTNETALMWMASLVDSIEERRNFLQRVLQLNPNNERAREALQRLGAGESGIPRMTVTVPEARTGRRRRFNIYLLAAAVITILLIIVVVAALTQGGGAVQVALAPTAETTSTATEFVGASTAEQLTATASVPTNTPAPPTPTVFGIIVTVDPARVNLPPTYTPTYTPEPSATPEPTATPLPLSAYPLVFSEYVGDSTEPRLFTALADGSERREIEGEGGFRHVALSADGLRIAFVRYPAGEPAVTEEGTPEAPASPPQLYMANLSDPGSAQRLTDLDGTTLEYPSWSPDGSQIVFASDADGDLELYIISAEGGEPERLTNNTALDTEPAWSPDGRTIAYTSDQDSPGFPEVYSISLETRAITHLTDDAGRNTSPAWSPDGLRIAYVSDRSGDPDIMMMDADGQREQVVTVDDRGAVDRSPVWSRDGRWIAFASDDAVFLFRWFVIDLSRNRQELPVGGGTPDRLNFAPMTG